VQIVFIHDSGERPVDFRAPVSVSRVHDLREALPRRP
jgi:hypothetical protein